MKLSDTFKNGNQSFNTFLGITDQTISKMECLENFQEDLEKILEGSEKGINLFQLIGLHIKKLNDIEDIPINPIEVIYQSIIININLISYVNTINLIKDSKFYKKLNEDQKNEFEKESEKLKSKIITPKGYDYDNLAKYYVECATTKKIGLPSVRDLAKGSDYNKDKWNILLKDGLFIFSVFSELQKIKMKKKYEDKEWFNEIYNYWISEFEKLQKKDRDIQKYSKAKEYDDER